jgi:hypothetical protein
MAVTISIFRLTFGLWLVKHLYAAAREARATMTRPGANSVP